MQVLKVNYKKILSVLFIVALVFSLGCSKKNEDVYTEQGKLKIKFWHAMGGILGKVLDDLIAEYNQSQDKYEVHTEFMGRYDILEQKIIASVMAENTPDIAQMYEGVTMFLTRDKGEESLIDLKPYVDKWDGYKDIFEVFQRNSTYDEGKIYSLPFNKSFPAMMYNKDILKLLNIASPPKTWAELRTIGTRVHKEVVVDKETSLPRLRREKEDPDVVPMMGYGFVVDPWTLEIMLLQNGGEMTNKDESQVKFDSDVSIDAMKFLVDAVREGWAYRTQGYNHQNDFSAQKVAFIITSSVSRKYMERKLVFPFSVAPIPMGKKKDVSIVSGTNISVFSSSTKKRQDGAWDFVKWFNSPEITARWAMSTFYVPTRKSSLELPMMKKWLKETEGGDAAMLQLPIGELEPRSSAWYRCRIVLRASMEKILSIVEKASFKGDSREIISQNLKADTAKMNKELKKYIN
ncbi:MAG: ABC transporter substrate-binding protein [Candidatus Cloacimonetes bacterium]|nr:ABC transporter substrate-binding protein [Candidatus Cloacimonadota bacterium]